MELFFFFHEWRWIQFGKEQQIYCLLIFFVRSSAILAALLSTATPSNVRLARLTFPQLSLHQSLELGKKPTSLTGNQYLKRKSTNIIVFSFLYRESLKVILSVVDFINDAKEGQYYQSIARELAYAMATTYIATLLIAQVHNSHHQEDKIVHTLNHIHTYTSHNIRLNAGYLARQRRIWDCSYVCRWCVGNQLYGTAHCKAGQQ